MNNRKILTLKEVLNLDRKPTLQEMVDLSIEDYAKYLFNNGIINYAPEILVKYLEQEKYEDSDGIVLNFKKYVPHKDNILVLNCSDYEPMFDRDRCETLTKKERANEYYMTLWNVPDDFELYTSEQWNNPNIIEKGVLINRYGVEVEYSIDNENKIIFYEKNLDGKYWNPTIYPHKLYYLKNYKK